MSVEIWQNLHQNCVKRGNDKCFNVKHNLKRRTSIIATGCVSDIYIAVSNVRQVLSQNIAITSNGV